MSESNVLVSATGCLAEGQPGAPKIPVTIMMIEVSLPNHQLMHPHGRKLLHMQAEISGECYASDRGINLYRFRRINGGFFEQVVDDCGSRGLFVCLAEVSDDGHRSTLRSTTQHGDG